MSKKGQQQGTSGLQGNNSDPPDDAHRKMVKGKMIEILGQYGQPTNQMDVEGIEEKIYQKVMRESKSKEQYNGIIQQLLNSLKKKAEQSGTLKMNAGQPAPFNNQQGPPGQQQGMNQGPNQGQQMNQSQGMAQHLRPQVPPHMAQQLIGGQPGGSMQQGPPPQQQPQQVMMTMAGGPGMQQHMMNSGPGQMAPNMGAPGMMNQRMVGPQGQMMAGPPMNVQLIPSQQMMPQGMNPNQMSGPGGPMPQQGTMNQDPMSALRTMAPEPGQRMRMPGPPQGAERPVFSPQTRMNNPNSPQVGGQWTPGQGMAPSPRPQMHGPQGQGPSTGMSPMPSYFNNSLNTPAPIQMGNSPSAPSPGPPPQGHFPPGSIGPGPNGPDPYLMKLQELSKYIEPLRNMIQRIQSDSSKAESKELVKIKQLLSIISNQGNSRVDFDTLRKCEEALEKMNLKMKTNHDQREQQHQQQQQMAQQQQMMSGQQQQQQMMNQGQNQMIGGNICQPLLDAFKEGMKRPNFSSFLSKTFGPAVAALGITSASDKVTDSNDSVYMRKKRKLEDIVDDENSLSLYSTSPAISDKEKKKLASDAKTVIEGEIARLDSKFKVQPDPLSHPGSDSTQVMATLDSVDLPYVPPVIISIPSTYPNHPPTLVTDEDTDQIDNPFIVSDSGIDFGYIGNEDSDKDVSELSEEQFFKRVNAKLDANLGKLPKLHSLTALLQTWEMSVRQACHRNV